MTEIRFEVLNYRMAQDAVGLLDLDFIKEGDGFELYGNDDGARARIEWGWPEEDRVTVTFSKETSK